MAVSKICIHCGAPVLTRQGQPAQALFDQELFRKSKILKLLECRWCELAADRYIESEGMMVLIDLVLQKPEAYRHVLFNGDYSVIIAKMALLTIICDGYIRWAGLATSGEFFEQEYQFYIMCLNVALGLLTFLSVVSVSLMTSVPSFLTLFYGMLMAYSARFCNVAALLWASPLEANDPQANFGPSLMWVFIYLLFFMATFRAIQVSTNKSLLVCAGIGILAHVAWHLILQFDFMIAPYSCLSN